LYVIGARRLAGLLGIAVARGARRAFPGGGLTLARVLGDELIGLRGGDALRRTSVLGGLLLGLGVERRR
jgi:hypothetical protein